MANFVYDNMKDNMLGAGVHAIDVDAGTIHAAIVSGADYTENAATHQDWDDVGTYTLAACYNSEPTQTLEPIVAITGSGGVLDSTTNPTFTAVAIDGVKDVDAVIVFDASSGVITTDGLICFMDGFTAVTPNGGDIDVTWGASILTI